MKLVDSLALLKTFKYLLQIRLLVLGKLSVATYIKVKRHRSLTEVSQHFLNRNVTLMLILKIFVSF